MTDAPAYLKTFKAYLRKPPENEDTEAIEKEFYGESDRSVVVLQGAAAENSLEWALRNRMRPDLARDVADDLFAFNGPLGTFSSKIVMSYALSIFGKITYHDLEIIRELRNAFAHNRKPLRFETPVVKDMCMHLQIPDIAEIRELPVTFREDSFLKKVKLDDNQNPKARYIVTVHSIVLQLYIYSHPKEPHGGLKRDLP
jgi:DNA-binding MltR family transcriptional regulator